MLGIILTFLVADLEPFFAAPEADFFYTIKLSLLLYVDFANQGVDGQNSEIRTVVAAIVLGLFE